MKAVGIIAEYNPFHNGHLYHLNEAKKLAGSDVVVVAMSGNYVQRGEPAILNKWDRTKLALQNGADVVVEIPTYFCLGNAKQYADAGTCILDSFGAINSFAFGSECGDLNKLKEISNNFIDKQNEIEEGIKEGIKEGLSYPAAREKIYTKLFPSTDSISLLQNSNDNLAISYLMSQHDMEAIAVKRENYKSASEIREKIKIGENLEGLTPKSSFDVIQNNKLTFPDDWFKTLKYAVLQMSGNEIDECPSGGEGLGNRIKNAIQTADTWDELVHKTKSKRYTYTRISRLCMQIILGIKRNNYQSLFPKYIRLLGADENGRNFISYCVKNELNKLPIITNITRCRDNFDEQGLYLLNLDAHATDVYNFITERDVNTQSDYKIPPIII